MGMKASLFRKLPPSVKQEVRRWRYGKLIDRNRFRLTCSPLAFVIPSGNLYQCQMTSEGGDFVIKGYPFRKFLLQEFRVSFVKIDAECCDAQIVRECAGIISRDRSAVIAPSASVTEL